MGSVPPYGRGPDGEPGPRAGPDRPESTARQNLVLTEAAIEDPTPPEEEASASSHLHPLQHPKFSALPAYARPGDTVHISEMSRLVRGTAHTLDVLDDLHRGRFALRIHDGAFPPTVTEPDICPGRTTSVPSPAGSPGVRTGSPPGAQHAVVVRESSTEQRVVIGEGQGQRAGVSGIGHVGAERWVVGVAFLEEQRMR